ncbi:flagellar motor protein MotB [Colwellia sp. 4_MG-2023]|uniref:flagellar motor protein MotB n=1 Tax=unclassified Colwellia TaxID=196834 RepID=UPI001C08453A|nr:MULTISPECIES: flagellar motor protein MotB [unclassified Colwellia]MBU2923250.1 flagellar motor protein MotB [Colwellia sp. C2M11]MDO6486653.1 flagellar motor protein MotB [Colwellia sp. 6_MG-2023]MDO6506722.1 flagellar motor protein MotB [Colwellia sp. 5_MG-2023]MDO6555548.1 flagellar motor protein MotB [Colwellia sp. 4_MG-2023]MDO6651321.1 flagellar motor protein MotB [Colwellia sp. 3_MG-2023]
MTEQKCKCPPPGLPAWMGTFADLMSLLMCFFVLLLSFSEMDVLKFKQIAGSMKFAFGVQNKIEAKDIPKGTSIIAQEFRPGKPEPTPIEVIQQQTMEITQQMLEFEAGEENSAGGRQEQRGSERGGKSQSTDDALSEQALQKAQEQIEQAAQDQVNELVKKIADKLEEQIEDGAIELESLGQQVIIRIRENGSFPSGSAFLQPKFKPIIRQIGELLNTIPGEIMISGNTDNRGIDSELFDSNWDLSSKRAVAIAHEIIKVPGFNQTRLVVAGHADTRPLVPNTNPLNRRRNRRVEIAINQGKPKESEPIQVLQ